MADTALRLVLLSTFQKENCFFYSLSLIFCRFSFVPFYFSDRIFDVFFLVYCFWFYTACECRMNMFSHIYIHIWIREKDHVAWFVAYIWKETTHDYCFQWYFFPLLLGFLNFTQWILINARRFGLAHRYRNERMTLSYIFYSYTKKNFK